MSRIPEFKFEFFNDIMKTDDIASNNCTIHKDGFVSYCQECRHPLCVQDMLIHSRTNPSHNVKSFNELQTILLETINSITDNLKNNLEKIDKYKIPENKDSTINAIKQRGIDQIVHLKQQIFESLGRHFDHIQAKWISMFDQNHIVSMQKEKLFSELNQLMKLFLKSKQSSTNLEPEKGLVYENLKEIISTISLLKDKDLVDKRVSEFLSKLDIHSSSHKFPELSVNKVAYQKFQSEYKNLLNFVVNKDFENINSPQILKIKQEEFFKSPKILESTKINVQSNEIVNKFIPIIAKNRRLMIYDTSISSFKEFMLSELHSIPHAAQIIVSSANINKFMLVGGHYFKKPSDKVFELDATNSEFLILESLKTPRWMHRMVNYKNFFYAIGGVINEKEQPTNSVERYDIGTKKWIELKPLKYARHSHSAIVFDPNTKKTLSIDKKTASIFVIGGIGLNRRYVSIIEKYDFDKGFWTEFSLKNNFQFELIGPFCAQINSKEVVVFGGFKYHVNESLTQTQKTDEMILQYPFNNSHVFTLSLEEKVVSCNSNFYLPFGLMNTGNQIIPSGGKLFFVGGLNICSYYQDMQEIDFSQHYNNQKVVGCLEKDKLSILDHVLFHN